jgi:glycosyltransferase involved in cell wall biosynthesis
MELKKILLFADWYEPGFRAGGPIRSCVNFVRQMRDDYLIYVFTRDRDLGSETAYPGISPDHWVTGGDQVMLFYCSPAKLTLGKIRSVLHEIDPDLIYLNSMFSRVFTIYPLLLSRSRNQIVLSPRGMLRQSALRFKAAKKKIFLGLMRTGRISRRIQFHAVDDTERLDILKEFGSSARISQIPNFPGSMPDSPAPVQKRRGQLLLLFAGRIHPIKGLDFLLRVLQTVGAEVRLEIAGTLEDKHYWKQCQELISRLPVKVSVVYRGEMPGEELNQLIAAHHVFALPTQGENFGHAILEALSLGRPVLISDQTPWRGLREQRAGWDLPLNRPEQFSQAIEEAAGLDQDSFNQWSQGAWQYALNFRQSINIKAQYKILFS